MLFNINNALLSKRDKKFFNELSDLFIRISKVLCEKYGTIFDVSQNKPDIEELVNIGALNENINITQLSDVLGDNYKEFIVAVNLYKKNKYKWNKQLDFMYNSERKKMQQDELQNTSYALVDFFSGAGGLSLGFRQEGFHIKLANDIEDVCVDTYKINHPELPSSNIVQNDIKNIVDNIENYIKQDIDVVVGGPPCQGFSEANRQRIIDDPRNKLYKYFIEAVTKIEPKFVVMENVRGMLKVASQVVEDYKKIKTAKGYNYIVSYDILNAQNFSVAQSRERLIYIAIRKDIAQKHNIKPDDLFREIKNNTKLNKIYNLEDALDYIKILEAQREKNKNEDDCNISGKKVDINKYNTQNAYLGIINDNKINELVFNHKSRYCSELNFEIYNRLQQGDDATSVRIKDIMPYAHRNHCFKDKYYKLVAKKPCRTITAHLRMDCHSHIHPFQVRSITPREAARIQSFPDSYIFLGPYLKTYMQIGNAVPPLMARGVAKVIKKYL